MKKDSSLICLVIGIFAYLFVIQNSFCQPKYLGTWEGIFMNDFEVLIHFNVDNENSIEGNIKMMAGGNIIQNDKITNIKLTDSEFTFYIPDKKTPFEGNFNNPKTELTGVFIFPDDAKHPIKLKRKTDKSDPTEEFKLLKDKVMDAEGLYSDLSFLYTSLKEHHPQLYAFTPEDSMDKIYESLNSELGEDLTLEKFYLKISQLTDAVRCTHTGIKLPITYQNSANRFGRYFPFRLFFKRDRAYFISGKFNENDQISPGNEIISINDIPVKNIIEQLLYLIPSEACNTTTKYHGLNKRFNTLFYLLNDSEEFHIQYKTRVSNESIIVPSVSLEDIQVYYDKIENNNAIDFSYIEDGTIGLLKVPTFAIPEMDQYFQQLDSVFSDLKATKAKDLIIDLRDNPGGLPIFAAQLFSYLTDKDFVYFKRNKEVKEFEPLYNTMQPNKLNFNGNLFVFINGGCLSTTGHLISLLKFHTNAIFIGEEPGSTFRCNDFSMQLTLPHTNIGLNVPRTTFETSVSGFGLYKPFPIDYEVNNTSLKIINSEDAYLEIIKEIRGK